MHKVSNRFEEVLTKHTQHFHGVVKFNPGIDKLIALDFTACDREMEHVNTSNIHEFSKYLSSKLKDQKAKFGIGGYNELRTFYKRSELFDKNISGPAVVDSSGEPRRLHIGTDIWGKEGTEVFAPLDARIHSFAFNNNFGDYGATIILQHQLEATAFFTLYGHVSLRDLVSLKEGDKIKKGQLLAHFGNAAENGNWPAHLHFQIIENIFSYRGDYPGVCKLSEGKKYLKNSPDPDLILHMNQLIFPPQ